MSDEEQLAPTFPLMIDEERADAFTILYNVATLDGGMQLRRILTAHNLNDAFEGMLDDFSIQHHARKWCKDDECEIGKED